MIKEAIDRILDLAQPAVLKIGDANYTHRNFRLELVVPPEADPVQVTTLQSLKDLHEHGLDEVDHKDVLIHVVSPTTVKIIARDSDAFGRRHIWAHAEHLKVQQFTFGSFMPPEQFIIGLQSSFQPTFVDKEAGARNDLNYVLQKASSITAERITTNADDGVSQNVTLNRSIALKDTETLRSRVQLAPYRTFPELNQPLSAFLFRARQPREGVVELALFEADGGKWRIDAMAEIKRWLSDKFTDIPIVT